MNDNIFVDTNILVYSVADDLHKRAITHDLLMNRNIIISSQVISEFIAVTLRKSILEMSKVIEYTKQFMQIFQIALITKTTINLALEVMAKYHLAYWDSLIIATGLENFCMILYSEDLQDGQCIEDKIIIVNPFKKLHAPS
jgi:predicted nucleic acid-binding protein